MVVSLITPLTQHVNVSKGSHIVYFYDEAERYIDNAVSFVTTGIEHNQRVVFIDSAERYAKVRERLAHEHFDEHAFQLIHYVNSAEFFEVHDDSRFEQVLHNLNRIIQPYVSWGMELRLWKHVDWNDSYSRQYKKMDQEAQCELTISDLGYLTVCAYNGKDVPASVFMDMMKNYEYLMTDDELVRSSLYRSRKRQPPVFPSLSDQNDLESEMDLYKQKLDFVHVVSHEVRNPLTVIKAYAALVIDKVHDERDRSRLKAIGDYVTLIDSEITHIINTEQMLSTEALWRKRIVRPSELPPSCFRRCWTL